MSYLMKKSILTLKDKTQFIVEKMLSNRPAYFPPSGAICVVSHAHESNPELPCKLETVPSPRLKR